MCWRKYTKYQTEKQAEDQLEQKSILLEEGPIDSDPEDYDSEDSDGLGSH